MPTAVPADEFRARLDGAQDRLADTEADAAAWFGATAIEYLTGFHHIQTERPVCLAVTPDRVEVREEDEHHFELVCEAQETAFDAMGPGVELPSVDEAVQRYFEEQGIADLARHHVGHNIGLGAHEPPYIDHRRGVAGPGGRHRRKSKRGGSMFGVRWSTGSPSSYRTKLR